MFIEYSSQTVSAETASLKTFKRNQKSDKSSRSKRAKWACRACHKRKCPQAPEAALSPKDPEDRSKTAGCLTQKQKQGAQWGRSGQDEREKSPQFDGDEDHEVGLWLERMPLNIPK
ncbi:hypothetical protein HAV15_005122 [Penicillium sp. str. |nr:hypothetical protein HAV15_005122 [Penicillium sp. str. \